MRLPPPPFFSSLPPAHGDSLAARANASHSPNGTLRRARANNRRVPLTRWQGLHVTSNAPSDDVLLEVEPLHHYTFEFNIPDYQ